MKKRQLLRIVALSVAIFAINNIYAQLPYLKHYTTNDGLPTSTIYGGTQDKDGFMWFGTDVGVTRFDGKTFRSFTIADGLSDNEILFVKQDSKGRIWFLGFNGTVSYYFKGEIFNSSKDTLLNQIKSKYSFVDLYEDKNNRIWFSTHEDYLLLDVNNKISRFGSENIIPSGGTMFDCELGLMFMSYYIPNAAIYTNNQFRNISLEYTRLSGAVDLNLSDGSILFQSEEGIIHQKDTIQKKIIDLPFDILRGNNIIGMSLTSENQLWLSVYGFGVYVYNYLNLNEIPLFLKIKSPGTLVCDHEGNVWIGTLDDGIFMQPEWTKGIRLINGDDGTDKSKLFSVSKNYKKEILTGDNQGVVKVYSNYKPIRKKIQSGIKGNNRILNIICEGDDIWLASDKGVYHYNEKYYCSHNLHSLHTLFPTTLISSAKDISINYNGLFILTHVEFLKYNLPCKQNENRMCEQLKTGYSRYYSVHASKTGIVWYSNVVGLFSLKDEIITSHATQHELLSKRINDIGELPDGTLVLATYGYGLLFYKNGQIIKQITNRESLASDICRKIFIFKDKVYVATPGGVSIIHYENGDIRVVKNFNTMNALPVNDVNDVFADDEEILIATSNGMVILNQESITKTKLETPLMHMLAIQMENNELDLDSTYTFKYNQNSFTFNYIGILFKAADEVVYRYRLNNKDDWQYTQNTSIDVLSLPSGKYSFQIQAKTTGEIWSSLKEFSFVIKPPFWKSNWFIISVVLLTIILTTIVVQTRFRNLKKKHRERIKLEQQINNMEQQALQAMMNPHFIFNVMNSIQQFINSNNKKAANHYLSEFARLIRMNLNLNMKGITSLEDEIIYLNLYLSLEKIRFGDRFSFEISISPDIDDDETMIPPMMIQPFLENAIWHGVLPLKGKGHVQLNLEKTAGNLIKAEIIDNGVGISLKKVSEEVISEEHKSYGMQLTRQRLELLEKATDTKLSVKISHAFPENAHPGTRVELLLPDLTA